MCGLLMCERNCLPTVNLFLIFNVVLLLHPDSALAQALPMRVKQKLSCPSFHCRKSQPYGADSPPPD